MAEDSVGSDNPNPLVKYSPVIFFTLLIIGLVIVAYVFYGDTPTIFVAVLSLLWLGLLLLLCFFNHYYIAWVLLAIPLAIFAIILTIHYLL